jgi:hypothetical protein
MSSESTQLLLTIATATDADQQELAELSQQLRAAVLESDAEAVEPTRGDAAPAGAKGDPITLAVLAVTIAPAAVKGLVRIIERWVFRHERASVTVEIKGAKLTLNGDPSDKQREIIDAFWPARSIERRETPGQVLWTDAVSLS